MERADDREENPQREADLVRAVATNPVVAQHTLRIERDAGDAEAHSLRGIALREMKLHELSLVDFERAIDLCGDRAVYYSNMGNTLKEMGRLDDALAAYSKAIEMDSSGGIYYSNRGQLLSDMDRPEQALRDFEAAIDREPAMWWHYLNRANLLQKLGRPNEATKDYAKALELDANAPVPDDVKASLQSKGKQ